MTDAMNFDPQRTIAVKLSGATLLNDSIRRLRALLLARPTGKLQRGIAA